MDKGHLTTDKLLLTMEKKLTAIYSRANKEVSEKMAEYLGGLKDKEKQLQEAIKAAKSPEERAKAEAAYKSFMENATLKNAHYNALAKSMAENLKNVNQTAMAYVNGQLPEVYALNYNAVGGDISGKVKGYSFDLVDVPTVKTLATKDETLLPYKTVDGKKDVRWNTKQVNSEIMQGILQGESIPDISKRLTHVTEMNLTSAIRNARTATTSAENRGRMDSYHRAQDMGVQIVKVWMATNDERTREEHLELDGQEREIDEPFENSLGEIMYPGDPDADPANVYNCRCTMVTRVLGFAKEEQHEDSFVEDLVEKEYSPHIKEFNNVEDYWAAKKQYKGEQTKYVEDLNEYGKLSVATGWVGGDQYNDKIPRIEATIASLNDNYPITTSGTQEYGLKISNLVVCDYSRAWEYLPDGENDRRLTEAAAQVFINSNDNSAVIAFNRPHLYQSITDAIEERENAIKTGEKLLSIGGANPEITAIHEWGHLMSNHLDNAMVYQDETVMNYWKWYKSLTKDEIQSGLSEYATTNRGEFEAECLAELHMPNPRPLAVKFKEYLDEIIKKGY